VRDYPFFKLYTANAMMDIVGKSKEEIGEYFLGLLFAWQKGDFEAMPEWLRANAGKCKEVSDARSGAAKKRWTDANAMQLHTNAMQTDANAMQLQCREEESRKEEKRIEKKKKKEEFVCDNPPSENDVEIYAKEIGFSRGKAFYLCYAENGWVSKGGQKIKNWKLKMKQWQNNDGEQVTPKAANTQGSFVL